MSSDSYIFFGFATGGAKAPQFVEPVFLKDEKLYVQAGISADNKIEGFSEYLEEIEYIEEKHEESTQIGGDAIFAVLDEGERLIYGDKKYVHRYLKQNLNKFLDSPYFLNEALKFTNSRLPEFEFISTSEDLLEAKVLSDSIKDYIESNTKIQIFLLKSISYQDPIIDNDTTFELTNSFNSKFQSLTVFGDWIEYARKKNQRLGRESRWMHLEEKYLDIFDHDYKLANFCAAHHVGASRSILSKIEENEDTVEELKISQIAKKKARLLDSIYSGSTRDFSSKKLELRYYNLESPFRFSLQSFLTDAIASKRASRVEISMQIYFLSLAFKFTIESRCNNGEENQAPEELATGSQSLKDK